MTSHQDELDHNMKMCGTWDGEPTPSRRNRDSWMCRCGKNHGKVFMKFHTGLAQQEPACRKCGGWLTDEQCRNLNEGRTG